MGDDQFRADTTTTDGFADELFTADVTYLRQPAWLTNPNIGLFRANNYLTVPVALYDNSNVIYNLELINQVDAYLYDTKEVNLEEVFTNLSFNSGLDCDLHDEMKHFNNYRK